ncbi:MAG: hypothetical protein QOJ02_3322 [Acidobacteriota bacterium]|jgi:hypothetical protein|nr:hypothetical protein [Acidobacteriota bacterium]
MKHCPVCQRPYPDDAQNFCLDDGTTLVRDGSTPQNPYPYDNRAAPTEVMHPGQTASNRAAAATTPPFLPVYPQKRNPLPWILGGLALLIISALVIIFAARGSKVAQGGFGSPTPSTSPGISPTISPAPSPTVSDSTWQTVTGDGFTISMPGTPAKSEQTEPSLAGPITVHLYTVTHGYEGYMAGNTRYPDSVFASGNSNDIMDGARNGAISGINGEVTSEHSITMAGYSGREITGKSPSKNLGFTIRMFVVKPQMYLMLYTQYDKDKPMSEDGRKYLDSFQITSQQP